jgi:hypothetical protein
VESKPRLSPAQEIAMICERVNITKNNLTKDGVVEVLKEYFSVNPALVENKTQIIKDFYKIMSSSDVKK